MLPKRWCICLMVALPCIAVGRAHAADEFNKGKWETASIGVWGVNSVLLKNGKVLVFDGPQETNKPRVTTTFTPSCGDPNCCPFPIIGTNAAGALNGCAVVPLCPGQAVLPDCKVLILGTDGQQSVCGFIVTGARAGIYDPDIDL